jgi:predicted permease
MSFPILVSTFANNILPIILLSGAGFVLGKVLDIDPRSLGRVAFYIFSPVLIFDLLTQNQLKFAEAATLVGFALCFILSIGALTLLVGMLLKFERPVLVSILITTMFANTGNYGLPLVSFAFGEQALPYAGIYFATMTLLFYTLGVFLASLGAYELQGSAHWTAQDTHHLCGSICSFGQHVECRHPHAGCTCDQIGI